MTQMLIMYITVFIFSRSQFTEGEEDLCQNNKNILHKQVCSQYILQYVLLNFKPIIFDINISHWELPLYTIILTCEDPLSLRTSIFTFLFPMK